MNKYILRYQLLLLSIALSIVGCSKEQLVDTSIEVGDTVEMRVKVDAPAGSSVANAEDAINRIRLVIFGSMGSPDAGRLIMNKFYATVPAGNNFKEEITTGKRDIYIIANEPLSGLNEELANYKNISTVDDIRKLSLVYEGAGSASVYTPSEIPMFMAHVDKQILPDSPNEISGEVERVMAKVTMKLNVKHSNFPVGQQVVIDNITIKNLPSQSYLIAKNYSEALVSSEKQSVRVMTPETGYDFSSNNVFYVPEYILSTADKSAYIEIMGHINGDPTIVSTWKIKLGDAMDDAGRYGNKYDVTRNHHYTFVGDVKSYGEMNDLAVKVTVLPWNTVNMEEDMGHYVAFDKVTNASDVVIADGWNLNDMGETIKVYCSTNIGGWYTVTKDVKGKEIHRSKAVATVSVETVQSVDVVIPEIGELDYQQSYTISIHQAAVASETVGPAKELKLIQYGGFIPNSELRNIDPVTNIGWWPVGKLPPHGLHVAKRGYQKMPDDIADDDDPSMRFTTVSSVAKETSSELGAGKSNMTVLVGDEHLAFKYCRDMGPEWFLASSKELRLIAFKVHLLGSSYLFTQKNLYHSSTTVLVFEGMDVGDSTMVDFNSTYNNRWFLWNEFSTIERIRCVRYI